MVKRIGIKEDVYDKLSSRKSPGQSFTGVLQELLEEVEE